MEQWRISSILPALQQKSDWSFTNAAQVTKQLSQNHSHIALIGNQATGCGAPQSKPVIAYALGSTVFRLETTRDVA